MNKFKKIDWVILTLSSMTFTGVVSHILMPLIFEFYLESAPPQVLMPQSSLTPICINERFFPSQFMNVMYVSALPFSLISFSFLILTVSIKKSIRSEYNKTYRE